MPFPATVASSSLHARSLGPGRVARASVCRYSQQRGFGLLEAIAAIAVLGFVVVMAANLADQSNADQRAAIAAQHMATVSVAANAYIKGNFAALQSVATPTTPATITVPMLVSTGFLPAGFSAQNGYGSEVCVQVLEPVADRLDAVAVAVGGTVLDDLRLGSIASLMGAAGGGVYASSPSDITGAMGGWHVPAAQYAYDCAGAPTTLTGHQAYALWFDQGTLETSTLYRDKVPGRPDLNTMNTPVIMASVQTAGAACTAGEIARAANGKVLSCQSGTFAEQGGSIYWADAVRRVTDPDGIGPVTGLSTSSCDASVAGQTRLVLEDDAGALLTPPRAYSCNGVSWAPLGLDIAGNLTVPGSLTAKTLQVSATVVENSACTTTGLISTDTSGRVLSCQAGHWKTQGSGGSLDSYAWYPDAGQGCYVNNYGHAIWVSSWHTQTSGGRYRYLTVDGVMVSRHNGYTYVDSVAVQGWVPPGSTWCLSASAGGYTYIYR